MTSPLRVGLVYPELLGTYGDRGNAIVLVQRARRRGIDAELVEVAAGTLIPDSLDIYLLGGGEDDPQVLAATSLVESAPALERARAGGSVILAVCAGFQLLGHRYDARDGTMDGLGLVDMTTVAGPERVIGELVVEPDPELGVPTLTGFENHGGRTTLGSDARPLGRVVHGSGNDGSVDGVLAQRIVGTYLHGPVLPRNPALADRLLTWIVDDELKALDDSLPAALHAERVAAAGERGFAKWRRARHLNRS